MVTIQITTTRPSFWPQGGKFARFDAEDEYSRVLLTAAIHQYFRYDALIRCWNRTARSGELVIFPSYPGDVAAGKTIKITNINLAINDYWSRLA